MTKEHKNRANVSAKAADEATDQNANESEIIEGEVVEEGNTTAEQDTVPAIEFQQVTEQLEKAQNQAKEYFDGWQRERADFSNYKRRMDRDQQMLAQNLKGDVIKKYLGVVDDLDRALKARPVEGNANSWADGIELIDRKLHNILESEGVRRIPAETEEFDPTRHEAISHEESPDHQSGEIIEVVQQGYMLGDRVLRPAMVRVAR